MTSYLLNILPGFFYIRFPHLLDQGLHRTKGLDAIDMRLEMMERISIISSAAMSGVIPPELRCPPITAAIERHLVSPALGKKTANPTQKPCWTFASRLCYLLSLLLLLVSDSWTGIFLHLGRSNYYSGMWRSQGSCYYKHRLGQ